MINITNLLLTASLAISAFSTVFAQGDTTWVQTYTWGEQNNPETAYDSPGRRWFEFPASTLMVKSIERYLCTISLSAFPMELQGI